MFHSRRNMTTLRWGTPVLLFLLLITFLDVSRADAAPPLPKLPGSATFSKISSPKGVAAADLTNEEIDATIAQIQEREESLRKGQLPDGISLVDGLPAGATPEEYQEWQRLTFRIVNQLDSRVQSLRFLKDIRQNLKDLETQRKGWRGFSEKPPYPMRLVDNLQDSIKSRQLEYQSGEVRQSIVDGELTEFTANLRESRTLKRLAEERLEQGRGKPDEVRFRWLLALATRRNELNEIGSINSETQRQVLHKGMTWVQQDLAFLDQKLALAVSNVRFTKDELDRKQKELESRRTKLQQEQESAIKAEDVERVALERAREALQRFKDISTTAAVTPRLTALRQALDIQQVRVETTGVKILTLKVMIRLLAMERSAWDIRYRIANPVKEGVFPDIKEVQKDLVSLQSWTDYLAARLESVENHIRSQQTLLAAPDLPPADQEISRSILTSYLEQKETMLRLREQISGTEQLIHRLDNEIAARTGKSRRVKNSVKGAFDDTLSVLDKLWTTELYVAEETVTIEGQKIVKTRSITVGKVISALLILFIGLYAARKAINPFSQLVARKFQLSANDAHVFARVVFYVIFVIILIFSLVTVNIPLAVFAFFGGALAIGVGFGAQTLINNFISGLILLFDRTIRLNDVVEVDGHRGRVTAINIRSSRVKRFDGIEILVPNSHFLQQNVVNLTLSDQFTRYEIPLGVAYGVDTETAEEVILRAVTEQPEVLADPEPYVVFEAFADSSLNFRAFFWLNIDPAVNNNIILSKIRHRISAHLAQAGITIPFPQRDVHLDTSQPLKVSLLEGNK